LSPKRACWAGHRSLIGDNGSGKSSYVSVTKKTCKTRGEIPEINTNLFDPDSGEKRQVAEVHYETDSGNTDMVRWEDGVLSSQILQAVDVFDTKSAEHYIASEDEIAFIPSGLVVLEKLARACEQVDKALNEEKSTLITKKFDYDFLMDEHGTPVSVFLSSLSSNTTKEELDNHTKLDKKVEVRIKELDEKIVKLKATDPQKTIRENNQKIQRLKILKGKYDDIEKAFSVDTLIRTKDVINEFVTARDASKTASDKAFSNLPVEGVGNVNWKALWESARKFIDIEHEREVFPIIDDDANCPLCLQDLDEDAKQRFTNFEEFVKADLQKQLDTASTALDSAHSYFEKLSFGFADSEPVVEELEEDQEGYRSLHDDFIKTLEAKNDKVMALLSEPVTLEQIPTPTFEETPIGRITLVIASLETEIEKLGESSSIAAELKKLEDEHNGLIAVRELTKYKEQISTEIERLKKITAIEQCIRLCRTNAITNQSNHLSEQYVTTNLKDNFKDELRKLGFRNIEVVSETHGVKGKQYHYLQLDTTYGVRVSLKDILSEGEHRCISLATFFSEVSISEHKSAVIFDDPVSSLDHRWRRTISRRIAQEAKERQVIIFTHDITFLLMTQEFGELEGCDITVKSLTRKRTETGIPADGPPWDAMKVNSRIGVLKNKLVGLKKIEQDETEQVYAEHARVFYRNLRASWERGVEEVVLNGAVVRFGREVQTSRLAKIVDLTDADYKLIEENMSKCSTMFGGHDSAPELIESMPNTEELEADLLTLETYMKKLRKQRN
jgi:ABC-type enterochelin transport system ATPase subunit